MKYNPLRLQKKFDNINTNKNKFMTLKEAINYAKTQQPNGLRPLNKQRFTNANTRTPFDRLNISEYLNMARQKRGIVKNSNVALANKQSKQVHRTPGKLSPNRGAFLKTLPVHKTYNAAQNGAQVKKNHNGTLNNANKNFKVSVANKQSKQVHLAPGKLSPNRGAFLTATLPVTKSYNSVSSIKQSQSRFKENITAATLRNKEHANNLHKRTSGLTSQRFKENITAATLRNKVHAYNLHKRTSGLTSQTFKENITAAKNKDKSNKRDKLHKALNNLINQYIL